LQLRTFAFLEEIQGAKPQAAGAIQLISLSAILPKRFRIHL